MFIYDFISCFDYYITPGCYFLPGAQVLPYVFPFPIYMGEKTLKNSVNS